MSPVLAGEVAEEVLELDMTVGFEEVEVVGSGAASTELIAFVAVDGAGGVDVDVEELNVVAGVDLVELVAGTAAAEEVSSRHCE